VVLQKQEEDATNGATVEEVDQTYLVGLGMTMGRAGMGSSYLLAVSFKEIRLLPARYSLEKYLWIT